MSDIYKDKIYEFKLSPSMERFYSNDSYYGVYEFITEDDIPNTKSYSVLGDGVDAQSIGVIAGKTGKLEYGVEYNVKAEVEYNQKYKSWQYKPIEIYPIVPTDVEKSRKFLKSIITERQTEALLNKYPNIIDIIMNGEDVDLSDVSGIKEKSFQKIKEKVESSYGMMELTIFLNPLGVSPVTIKGLFESGTSADVIKRKIQENPYIISRIKGFGFKRADDIALKINPCLKVSRYRAEAFVRFLLNDIANQHGHTWVNTGRFLEECRLNIPECKEIIFEILKDESSTQWLHIDRERKIIGLKSLYNLEENIAKELIRLKYGFKEFHYRNFEQRIKDIEKDQGWEFTEEQLNGVRLSTQEQVIAIVGGGGVGKTSTVTAITKILNGYDVAQTALSGKAALRLQEVTGIESSTIHRLLGFQEGKFIHNKDNKLDVDIVVVDEASMIGADLFYSLLQAIPTGSKLITVGDIGQLESIGVGSVFKDILDSNIIPTISLTQIHRQAQKSAIITESIKIRHQKHIIDKNFYGTRLMGELKDLQLDVYENKDETVDKVLHYFKQEYGRVQDIMEVQVIVPMRLNGNASVYRLNNKIQDIVNPSSPNKNEISLNIAKGSPYIIREGDKVMNMVNQYKTMNTNDEETPVFNGNLGIVKSIYNKAMIIDFIGIGELVIEKKNWRNIELGYASTCHKFQGSQSRSVIIGVDSSSYVMLSKEWLYTAISRAEEMCILCGDNFAIRKSVQVSNLKNKLTHLKELLIHEEFNYNKSIKQI